MSWRGFKLLPVALSLALSACFVPNTPEQGGDTLQIASVLPLTGALSSKGPSRQRAADLAVFELNQAGKVAGKTLEILHRDSETNGEKAAATTETLLQEHPNLKFLIGASSSAVSQSMLKVAEKQDVLMISPSSTSPALSKADTKDVFYRTVPSDDFQGCVLATKIMEFGIKKIGVLTLDNTYGNSLTEVLKFNYEKQEGQVVQSMAYQESATAELPNKIKALLDQDIEAVVFIGYPSEAPAVFKAWLDSGKKPQLKWFFSDSLKDVGIFKGLTDPTPFDQSIGTIPSSANQNDLIFQDAYVQRYAEFPVSFSAHTYDATVLAALALHKHHHRKTDLKQALKEVASPPGVLIKPGVEEFKKALRLIEQGQDIDYQGASGEVDMDINGDVLSDYEIWTLKKGFILRSELLPVSSIKPEMFDLNS